MQAIDRIFSALRAIHSADGSAGVSDVARATGLPKSTVSRLLASLEEVGAVERVDEAGAYVIGPAIAALTGSGSAIGSLRDVARPYLRELTETMGEGSGLVVADGPSALYVDHLSSEGSVTTRDWTGMRFPYHTVAGGLALLMTWSDVAVDNYVRAGLERFTDTTVGSAAELRQRLVTARRDGFVWTMGDFDAEINGVAAPVTDGEGHAIGAVSVYGPSYRFPGARDPMEIGAIVRQSAAKIQEQIRG